MMGGGGYIWEITEQTEDRGQRTKGDLREERMKSDDEVLRCLKGRISVVG